MHLHVYMLAQINDMHVDTSSSVIQPKLAKH